MTPKLDSSMTYGVGDHALNAAFPDLFSLACCKDASVVDHLEFFNYSSIENYLFQRFTIGRWVALPHYSIETRWQRQALLGTF
jgi:hypothetical protein